MHLQHLQSSWGVDCSPHRCSNEITETERETEVLAMLDHRNHKSAQDEPRNGMRLGPAKQQPILSWRHSWPGLSEAWAQQRSLPDGPQCPGGSPNNHDLSCACLRVLQDDIRRLFKSTHLVQFLGNGHRLGERNQPVPRLGSQGAAKPRPASPARTETAGSINPQCNCHFRQLLFHRLRQEKWASLLTTQSTPAQTRQRTLPENRALCPQPRTSPAERMPEKLTLS